MGTVIWDLLCLRDKCVVPVLHGLLGVLIFNSCNGLFQLRHFARPVEMKRFTVREYYAEVVVHVKISIHSLLSVVKHLVFVLFFKTLRKPDRIINIRLWLFWCRPSNVYVKDGFSIFSILYVLFENLHENVSLLDQLVCLNTDTAQRQNR